MSVEDFVNSELFLLQEFERRGTTPPDEDDDLRSKAEELSTVEKFNPNRDEMGRFAETPAGGAGKPAWDKPPANLSEFRERIALLAQRDGEYTDGDLRIARTGRGGSVENPMSQMGEMLDLQGAIAMTTWEGDVVLSTRREDDLLEIMKSGVIDNQDEFGTLQTIRHEVVHKIGIGGGKAAYQTRWGRALEEGLTEHITQQTSIQYAKDLGFTIKSGIEPTRLFYKEEVNYVDRLAGLISDRTGVDKNKVIERWKYNVNASKRLDEIVTDLANAQHPDMNMQPKSLYLKNIKQAIQRDMRFREGDEKLSMLTALNANVSESDKLAIAKMLGRDLPTEDDDLRSKAEMLSSKKFNPNRDEAGRFADAPGGGVVDVGISRKDTRDYWDQHLERNALRRRRETSAGAFLATKLENAGDILRELALDRPAMDYIQEKIGRIKRELKVRDWNDKLSQTETADLTKIRSLVEDIPVGDTLTGEVKNLIRHVVDRDPSKMGQAVDAIEGMLTKEKHIPDGHEQINHGRRRTVLGEDKDIELPIDVRAFTGEVMLIPDYVSLVGSLEKDIDVVVRVSSLSESDKLAISKQLGRDAPLHFVANPTGPHADYYPIGDLIVRMKPPELHRVGSKAMHRRDRCMDCTELPTMEVKWAEGMAHAWFCDAHLAEFKKERGPGDEIDYERSLAHGVASAEWSDGAPTEAEAAEYKTRHKANPYHDELGRFTTGDGGSKGAENATAFNDMKSMTKRAWLEKYQSRYDTNSSFKAAADAVSAYTKGAYRRIREAGQYVNSGVLPTKSITDAEYRTETLYLDLRDNAFAKGESSRPNLLDATRELQNAISGADKLSENIYRGASSYRPKSEDNPLLKIGDVFDILGPSSFTTSREIAEKFAHGGADGGKSWGEPDRAIVYEIKTPKAIHAEALSRYKQQEVITDGRFKVVDVKIETERVTMTRAQSGSFAFFHPENYVQSKIHIILEQIGVPEILVTKTDDISYRGVAEEGWVTAVFGSSFLDGEFSDKKKATDPSIKIDLGCGDTKPDGYIGVDWRPGDQVDVLYDMNSGVLPFHDEYADEIRADHSLEHLPDIASIMGEIYRVLKPGGVADITVPSTDDIDAFANPSHKSYWNSETFDFFVNPELREAEQISFGFDYISKEEIDRGDAVDVAVKLRKPESTPK